MRYYNRRVPDTRWWQYVEAISGEEPPSQIAQRMGVDASHLTRWKNGQIPTPPFVKKFADAYNRNALEAFVAAEYITDEDAALREVKIGADELTNEQLLDEIRRRLRPQRGS